MGRRNLSAMYIAPIKSDGSEVALAPSADASVNGLGVYTLEANTTYFFPVDGADAVFLSATLRWDAEIAITAAKVEDTDFPPKDHTDYDTTAGVWIDEDPSTAFVGFVSAGTTVTNGVVAHTAGASGGCRFNIASTGARRTRIRVDVGATGGEVMLASWGKE